MQVASDRAEVSEVADKAPRRNGLIRWGLVLLVGLAIVAIPAPEGITPQSWRLLAIFAATIVGLIAQPLPGGAMVLIGVGATALLGVMPINQALLGIRRPCCVARARGLFHVARNDQDRTRKANRFPVHPRNRASLAGAWVRADFD